MDWSNEYPHSIYASVLLLNDKIESWKVGKSPKSVVDFTHHWKMDRLNDYASEYKEFIANDKEDHELVFTKLAPEYFSRWELADDYKGFKPY